MLIDTEAGRVRTHWWRRESEQRFRSWESTVLGGAVFEAQLTLGQLKSPNTIQPDRRDDDGIECTNKGYVVRGWGTGATVYKGYS